MVSSWINECKAYAKKHGVTYGEAMTICSQYKREKPAAGRGRVPKFPPVARFAAAKAQRPKKTVIRKGKAFVVPRKGKPMKTRKGEKAFTTKKPDVVFHQAGKYVRKARKPFEDITPKPIKRVPATAVVVQ